jgi:hypothetical protein
MPQPSPPGPHCGGATAKNRILSSGFTQYRCKVKSCRKYTTPETARGKKTAEAIIQTINADPTAPNAVIADRLGVSINTVVKARSESGLAPPPRLKKARPTPLPGDPSCPECGSAAYVSCILKSGLTQYYCRVRSCGKRFTPGAKRGRPKKEQPLTPAERSKASRDRQSPEQRTIAIEKNRLRRKAKRDAKRILRDAVDATEKMSI